MEENERPPWLNFLEGDVIGKETPGEKRVYQVVIRVRAEGLMAVVKARKGPEYFVCFVGGPSFPSLAAKVRNVVAQDLKSWRQDQYPPT